MYLRKGRVPSFLPPWLHHVLYEPKHIYEHTPFDIKIHTHNIIHGYINKEYCPPAILYIMLYIYILSKVEFKQVIILCTHTHWLLAGQGTFSSHFRMAAQGVNQQLHPLSRIIDGLNSREEEGILASMVCKEKRK